MTARLTNTLPALTGREREVLALAADGHTNGAIGHRLGIAPATAKRHIDNILTKLCATDRAHAVAIAMRAGVIA